MVNAVFTDAETLVTKYIASFTSCSGLHWSGHINVRITEG